MRNRYPFHRSPFEILNVSVEVAENDLKLAFRQRAKFFHPDRNPDPKAADQLIEVIAAFEALNDPNERAYYRARFHPHLANPIDFAETFAKWPTWETDSYERNETDEPSEDYTHRSSNRYSKDWKKTASGSQRSTCDQSSPETRSRTFELDEYLRVVLTEITGTSDKSLGDEFFGWLTTMACSLLLLIYGIFAITDVRWSLQAKELNVQSQALPEKNFELNPVDEVAAGHRPPDASEEFRYRSYKFWFIMLIGLILAIFPASLGVGLINLIRWLTYCYRRESRKFRWRSFNDSIGVNTARLVGTVIIAVMPNSFPHWCF